MGLVKLKRSFPQDMYTQLSLTAKIQGKSITQLLREFIAKGLQETAMQQQRSTTQALLNIAEQAEQESLFDCYVMATSKKYNLTHIFLLIRDTREKRMALNWL